MSKWIRDGLTIVLCLCALLVYSPGVMAAEESTENEKKPLHIENAEEFLAFAEACRLDTYSENLLVSLDTDLDLTGVDWEAIPIFSGTLEGNGHTISGVNLCREGSVQGLFRYLTEDACVQDLTVKGEIRPAGTHNTVGGIAGSNAGRIVDCRFDGTVSGGDSVGGIVGINTMTGVVEGCRVSGTVTGNHFAGGIVGANAGVIRDCSNAAAVNTTSQQNTVDLDDITIDTITGTESAGTVTDVGGVAGVSTGVIRDCTNRGAVGYQQMGYNIGGIAGTQKGYIFGCENFGPICGRKEVGGIVGQMEPVVQIEYSVDTLQILSEQLDGMSGIVNRVSVHTQSGTADMGNQVEILSGQVGDAAEAVHILLDNSGSIGGMPDPDTMQAIENTLFASMTDINGTMSDLVVSMENTMYALAGDIQALSGQINAMSETIEQARENIGVAFVDVSDEDTPEQLSGKVDTCINYGSVLADLNAGGIAGAVAPENDMDGHEDVLFRGDDSMNLENEYRAVILRCDNKAEVVVKKQNGGGIAGWMAMGLVKECMNLGTVDAENADYLGGVVGTGSGYIRNCYSSCSLYGDRCVGGIAGSATIVSDCRSMVMLTGSETTGGILGESREPVALQEETAGEPSEENETETTEEKPVEGNYYLSLHRDVGGIDGISYAGSAEMLPMDEFMALDDIPVEFGTVVVSFVYEDGTKESISLVPGGKLKESQLPTVPEKEGYTAAWSGLEKEDLDCILTDLTFRAEYTAKNPTIQSSEQRENGMSVLLAQGLFSGDQTIALEPLEDRPALARGEEWAESWSFAFPNGGEVTKLRYSLPPGAGGETVRLLIRQEDGEWNERPFLVEGSYLVFSVQDGDNALCLINSPDLILIALLCAGFAVAVVLAVLLRKKLRKQ